MALIQIPNAYTSDMAASTVGRERFAVVGEPIAAVDLIDTVVAPGSPTAEDLLSADRDAEAPSTPGVHGARRAVAETGPASSGTAAARAGPDRGSGPLRCDMRESGRPRRFRSPTKRRSRSSC